MVAEKQALKKEIIITHASYAIILIQSVVSSTLPTLMFAKMN